MTLKWIGAACIFLGCAAFGFLKAYDHRSQAELLAQLLRSIEFMECHLAYRLVPLPELCHLLAVDKKGEIGQFWRNLYDELLQQIRPDVPDCVRYALARCNPLPQSVTDILLEAGSSLGKFDLSGQLQCLSAVKTKCRQLQVSLQENMDLRMRNYRTFGICAGAALVLLLL